MIVSSAKRGHAHGSNPVGSQIAQAMARYRYSISTKILMACDALGYAQGFILTGANGSDFDHAEPLLQRYLKPGANAIIDKGYDGDAIRDFIRQRGGIAVIPP